MFARIAGAFVAFALVAGVGAGTSFAAAKEKKATTTITEISDDGKTITVEIKKGKKDPGETKKIKLGEAKPEFPADTADADKKLSVGQNVEITFVKDSMDTAESVKVVGAKKKKKTT